MITIEKENKGGIILEIDKRLFDIIEDEFKEKYEWIGKKEENNLFFNYFIEDLKVTKDRIEELLNTEEEGIVFFLLTLIKFDISDKDEKYNISKNIIKLLKKYEKDICSIYFSKMFYCKFFTILKEVKSRQKNEKEFLEDFIFNIYQSKNLYKIPFFSVLILEFLGRESEFFLKIIKSIQKERDTDIKKSTYERILQKKILDLEYTKKFY